MTSHGTGSARRQGDQDLHGREGERLASLQRWQLVDPGRDLEATCRLAASVCSTPTSFVSLVGEGVVQVVAATNLPLQSFPREGALCAHVVEHEAELVVTDLREDPRFARQLARVQPDLIAFAGVPLIGRDGLPLGVLAVGDREPHSFTRADLRALSVLARGLVAQIEMEVRDASSSDDTDPQGLAGRVRRLRQALVNGELVVNHARLVDLRTGELAGLEGDLEWWHPQRGELSLAPFRLELETTSLAVPVERHVLHHSLRALRELSRTSGSGAVPSVPTVPTVTVRVSEIHLARPDAAEHVLAELEAFAVAPSQLVLSLDPAAARFPGGGATLRRLAAAGVGLEVHDLGGRAGGEELLDLPVRRLRLDSDLVHRLSTPRAEALVRATVALADAMACEVVACGVETAEQLADLRRLGCQLARGSLLEVVPQVRGERPSGRPRAAARSRHVLLEPDDGDGAAPPPLLAALDRPGGLVMVLGNERRVALEAALARQGRSPLTRAGYRNVDAAELLTEIMVKGRPCPDRFGSVMDGLMDEVKTRRSDVVVVSELAGLLWAAGQLDAALEVEELCDELPVPVLCSYPAWALGTQGTPHQRRRMHEQHACIPAQPAAPVVGVAGLPPGARSLVASLQLEGASFHSIAAALNRTGMFPAPGRRWHWRQVAVLCEPESVSA